MRYLVDTDWVIDGLAGRTAALGPIRRLYTDGLGVSIVTLAELFEGVHLMPDPVGELQRCRRFLSGFAVVPLIEPVAEVFGAERARLRQQGNLIPDCDIVIAATALYHDLTLLTRNLRHFTRFPGLRLYRSV